MVKIEQKMIESPPVDLNDSASDSISWGAFVEIDEEPKIIKQVGPQYQRKA